MKTYCILFLCILSLQTLDQQPATPGQEPAPLTLMPMPAQVRQQAGKFRLTNTFAISIQADPADTILYKAANSTYQALNKRTGAVFNRQYIRPGDTLRDARMEITVNAKATMAIGVDESYHLDIDVDRISLSAGNTIGALRGLQTLLQLAMADRMGYYFPCLNIVDTPRFKWRGLMIDVARHFISVDEIERNIDAMAAAKLDLLHWHLSDDEGFRVESKLFPRLQAEGSNGDYYTQAEIREVVQYAAERGIIVVPEFDMPGHAQSWFAGYPELASQPGPYRPGPRTQWQNEHPDPNRPTGSGIAAMITNLEAPTFDATSEKVYDFLDRFLGEMATLFPGPYIHIGADENNGLAWKLNPRIATWMKAHNMQNTDDLQRYFVSRVHAILAKHHRETMGWEELFNEKTPKDVVIQKWIPAGMGSIIKSHGGPADFAAHGNRSVISEGFYLDIFMPASIYYNNPAIKSADSASALGGEAAQWTELADNGNLAGRIWPRAAAIAERLWSPASVTDVDDMYRRLFAFSYELDQQGLLQLSNYERALRRLAGSVDITRVKTLTDVLTPVTGYQKMMANMMKGPAAAYQTTPLTSVSDIVFVDSETKRKFRALIKAYLETHDKTAERRIRTYLQTWQTNDAALTPFFAGNARLSAIQDQSRNLSVAAGIGLEALERIQKALPADSSWTQQKDQELETFAKAHAETQLAVIPEIESLVTGRLATEPASYRAF